MRASTSLFDRIFGRKHPAWMVISASLLLLMLPVGLAALDGLLADVMQKGHWRVLFLPPAVILYIGLVSPLLRRRGEEVVRMIQPHTALDADSFAALVQKASAVPLWQEVLAFCSGVVLGYLSAQFSGFDEGAPALLIYWFAATSLMYGVLVWTIFVSVVSTRLNAALLRLPLQIDLFDTSPYTTFGRQSLLLALVFLGGITISIVFSFQVDGSASFWSWLGYLPIILVAVLIFFLSMVPIHKVMLKARQEELKPLQKQVQQASRELARRLTESQSPGELPGLIQALTLYEQRLLAVRTWPYNTTMLRTLFFSILIPLLTVLVRRAAEVLFLAEP